MASGVEVRVTARQGYKDMRNNMTMARIFGAHLAAGGRTARETDARVGAGSTDMGDVSHVVPSIHPYLAIIGEGEALCHEHRFAAAAATDQGAQTALAAAKAMARTAIELLGSPGLRDAIRAEWSARR
jgi:metal-dependent amidase/aminoacylase/carboxypeptidase family protein